MCILLKVVGMYIHSVLYIVMNTLPLLQLLCLVQSHIVVAIVGESCSGKSSVIKVGADTLRSQGVGLGLSWLFPGALDEGDLFGISTLGFRGEAL